MSSTSDRVELTPEQRRALVRLARWSIERGCDGEKPDCPDPELCRGLPTRRTATFVTVYVDGELDGCIGTIQAVRPLPEDIVRNAWNAAFRDHRFDPVDSERLARMGIEISLLSPLQSIDCDTPGVLLSNVSPGLHGVMLRSGQRRGTFLPSVWDKVDDPETFLMHLKVKARIPADDWPDDLEAYRYTVQKIGDRE